MHGLAGEIESMAYDYLRDPDAIYRQSFATIEQEGDFAHLSDDERAVAIRVIHACGMVDVVGDLAFSAEVVSKARDALLAGAPVLCDVEMVKSGIIRRFLPVDNGLICTLNENGVADRAKAIGNTRSAAAVELWEPHLAGAVAVIGNAPTALYHLMELIKVGAPKPAAILGFPVGFVGAIESKQALSESALDFITLKGRRGGSAIASAALNAIAGMIKS